MKKNVNNAKAIFPMPVLMIATYNEDGSVDVMNAAWGTMYDYDKLVLNLDDSHKTVKNLLQRKALTVGLADKEHMVQADYVGIVSANNTPDKFEKSGLHFSKSHAVDAPIISEWPLTLECELEEIRDDGLTIAKIISTLADEEILDENGKIDPSKLNALIYDPYAHNYFVVGEKVGKAFQAGLKLK